MGSINKQGTSRGLAVLAGQYSWDTVGLEIDQNHAGIMVLKLCQRKSPDPTYTLVPACYTYCNAVTWTC